MVVVERRRTHQLDVPHQRQVDALRDVDLLEEQVVLLFLREEVVDSPTVEDSSLHKHK